MEENKGITNARKKKTTELENAFAQVKELLKQEPTRCWPNSKWLEVIEIFENAIKKKK